MFIKSRMITRAFAAIAFAATSLAASAADTSKDLAALEAADKAWVKAYNAVDADGMANLYDENAVLMPPGAPVATGRAAIRTFLAADAAASKKANVTFVLGPKPAGGVAGDWGWQSGSFTIKDKAGKVVDSGSYMSVSVKKGGKWLYVRDTYNSDVPPAPAASAAPAPAPAKK